MTTNCNDTCHAVDKLLLFYSVQKQMDMWGSIPSSFFFYSIITITLSQKTEMAFVISEFFFSFLFFLLKLPV